MMNPLMRRNGLGLGKILTACNLLIPRSMLRHFGTFKRHQLSVEVLSNSGLSRWPTINCKTSVLQPLYFCSSSGFNHVGAKDCCIENFQTTENGKNLKITWADGTVSDFDSIWLRHNCHCSECKQEASGQKIFNVAAVPADVTIEMASRNGDHLLISISGEGSHVNVVPLKHLKSHCYSEKRLEERRAAVRLTEACTAKKIPQIQYEDLMNAKDGLLRWLTDISVFGLCLVKGVPQIDGMIRKVVEKMCPLQETIYGLIFDVESDPSPINVAYSSVQLDFHMDLVYYESPPGLQFLHVLRFDDCVQGGESIFLDAFQVAEDLKKDNPEAFQTLVEVPTTFQKVHYEREFPVHMTCQRPHIVLNHLKEIVNVNWAPAFEGPLAVKKEDVERYYSAYEIFAKAIQHSPYKITQLLKPGDLIAFNNRRILHGRNEFHLNGGVRHLQGCYVNTDHFKSQAQVQSFLVGDGRLVKRVGNQDWF